MLVNLSHVNNFIMAAKPFAAADPSGWATCSPHFLMGNHEKQAKDRAGRLSSRPLGGLILC